METWIWIVGALLLGAVLGGVGAFLVARRRWADAARAEELQRELDGYKQEVGDHFVHTAELVNNLTRSYKAVYDHLEQGAYRLVDEETLRKQLGNVDGESVRLEYIGQRDAAAVLGPGAAASGTSSAASGASAEPNGAGRETSEPGAAASGAGSAASEPGAETGGASAQASGPSAESSRPDAASGTVAATDAADAETRMGEPPEEAVAVDPPPQETSAWATPTNAATLTSEPLDDTEPPATAEQAEDSDRGTAPWNREPESSDEDGDRSGESGPRREEGSVR